ncbi:MAG: TonB-dependent receptor plug domain-containing protein, partial [Chitinophagaceae bacterium]
MKLKPLLILLLLTVFYWSIPVQAQQRTISGIVTDGTDGTPLVGVSIQVKGTTIGTVTSTDGSFSLKVPAAAQTLVASYVGYTSKNFVIGSGRLHLKLMPSSSSLNQLVVIGYGSQKKKDFTGSIATVSSKDFNTGAISTPEQLITGKVAGVVITSNGGAPGSGSTIRIRGGSSLNASNDPLIVIDGVPVANDGVAGSPNALALINPNDIASFTILKDASAAAIYGNRASNGVIIITTKKGQAGGKLRVDFNSVTSESLKTNEVNVLNAKQFRQVVNQYGTPQQIGLMGTDTTVNTNWQDQIYRPAFGTDNNISFSGGVRHLPYRLSLEYLNQDGILKTNNLQRKSIDFNLNPVFLHDHLHVSINFEG